MVRTKTASKKSAKTSSKKNGTRLAQSSLHLDIQNIIEERDVETVILTADGFKIGVPTQFFERRSSGGRLIFFPKATPSEITISLYDSNDRPFVISYEYFLDNRSASAAYLALQAWEGAKGIVGAISVAVAPYTAAATVLGFLWGIYDTFREEAKNKKNAQRIIRQVVEQVGAMLSQLREDLKDYIDETALRDLEGKLSGARLVLQDIANDWTSESPEVQAQTVSRLFGLSDTLTFFVVGPLQIMVEREETNLKLAVRALPLLYNASALKQQVRQMIDTSVESVRNAIEETKSLVNLSQPILSEMRKVSNLQFYGPVLQQTEPGGPVAHYYFYQGKERFLTGAGSGGAAVDKKYEEVKTAEFARFAAEAFKLNDAQNETIQKLIAETRG
jgi:hypothetical protein